jgi:hypothetical protein
MMSDRTLWIISGIIAIITFIVPIITTGLKPLWAKIVTGISLFIILVCVIFPLTISKLEITYPVNRGTVTKEGYTIKSYDGKELVTIQVKITGKDLPKGKYVQLITSQVGGDESWVNGGSIPSDVIGETDFSIDNVTFGEKTDQQENYYLYLIMTNKQLRSGDVFNNNEIPDYIDKSNVVEIRVQKK